MTHKGNLLLLFACLLGTISVQLVTPTGGLVFVAGNSMDPAIPAGCNVVAAQSWDGESSLEGEVVAFDSEHVETDINGSSTVETNPWIAHRVVAEYDPYDMSEANHYAKKNGLLVAQRENRTKTLESPQQYADIKAMEGDRVLVLKGDNNDEIDRVLVHEDEVLGVLDERASVTIQESDSWPCSAVDPMVVPPETPHGS
ncbi:hypothetical protein D8Y22_06650 [Salinadaptatus halalkaliphilus]|uniref:Signal peptidase I n=1 Tax=Salinadaptatus halalkaliphilus TaxID=2419781 RepID=A0A4V3VLG6_9EURY|nr:hypothetical protein [Salinadaptatus halalkaliphilus]THE65607.1 hypothetical protein D8Y22_06650 [Salinadaptatus halalkaliphilus]